MSIDFPIKQADYQIRSPEYDAKLLPLCRTPKMHNVEHGVISIQFSPYKVMMPILEGLS